MAANAVAVFHSWDAAPTASLHLYLITAIKVKTDVVKISDLYNFEMWLVLIPCSSKAAAKAT